MRAWNNAVCASSLSSASTASTTPRMESSVSRRAAFSFVSLSARSATSCACASAASFRRISVCFPSRLTARLMVQLPRESFSWQRPRALISSASKPEGSRKRRSRLRPLTLRASHDQLVSPCTPSARAKPVMLFRVMAVLEPYQREACSAALIAESGSVSDRKLCLALRIADWSRHRLTLSSGCGGRCLGGRCRALRCASESLRIGKGSRHISRDAGTGGRIGLGGGQSRSRRSRGVLGRRYGSGRFSLTGRRRCGRFGGSLLRFLGPDLTLDLSPLHDILIVLLERGREDMTACSVGNEIKVFRLGRFQHRLDRCAPGTGDRRRR